MAVSEVGGASWRENLRLCLPPALMAMAPVVTTDRAAFTTTPDITIIKDERGI